MSISWLAITRYWVGQTWCVENEFVSRGKEPGDGKWNSIKCQAAEWQPAFDRTFSLIACILLRDLFIKSVLHFTVSAGVWWLWAIFPVLIAGAQVKAWRITWSLADSLVWPNSFFVLVSGTQSPRVLSFPKLQPKLGECPFSPQRKVDLLIYFPPRYFKGMWVPVDGPPQVDILLCCVHFSYFSFPQNGFNCMAFVKWYSKVV